MSTNERYKKPYEPIRLSSAKPEGETEKVVAFYVDDQPFEVPKKFPASVGLRYLRNAKQKGEEVATAELMIEVLGEDAFNQLCDNDNLTHEEFNAMSKFIAEIALSSGKS